MFTGCNVSSEGLKETNEKGVSNSDLMIPLLLQNKPPVLAGREDDELADVDLRPESVS